MSKNSFYRKMIVSVAGATLLAVGVNQLPVNALGSTPTEVSAAKKLIKLKSWCKLCCLQAKGQEVS
ncbi:hypothetical protein SDC49_25055 [Lactobacillus sp. R2/2]|nr:hypothetical protein [Lactobacillus sp. R2/2]